MEVALDVPSQSIDRENGEAVRMEMIQRRVEEVVVKDMEECDVLLGFCAGEVVDTFEQRMGTLVVLPRTLNLLPKGVRAAALSHHLLHLMGRNPSLNLKSVPVHKSLHWNHHWKVN